MKTPRAMEVNRVRSSRDIAIRRGNVRIVARNVYCGLDYLSPAFRAAIGKARIELLTYKNIVRELGPDSMYPPEDLASYSSTFAEED